MNAKERNEEELFAIIQTHSFNLDFIIWCNTHANCINAIFIHKSGALNRNRPKRDKDRSRPL